MPITIVATPGASNANSYLEVAEADAYFAARFPLSPTAWEDIDPELQKALLVMATRQIDALFRGTKVLVQTNDCNCMHYVIRRMWTGQPASSTQRLAWPRVGMIDQNGNAIPSDIIPQDLKDATAELAGQLSLGDRTLDNDVSVQGITSVRAGSVAVTFRDGYIDAKVLPDAVTNLLVPGWYVEERYEPAQPAIFEVLG